MSEATQLSGGARRRCSRQGSRQPMVYSVQPRGCNATCWELLSDCEIDLMLALDKSPVTLPREASRSLQHRFALARKRNGFEESNRRAVEVERERMRIFPERQVA